MRRSWLRLPGLAGAFLGSLLAALTFMAVPARADTKPLLRISTENAAGHVQTRIVARFAEALRARIGDRLEVVHEHGAALFRDRDVITALQQGQVEMAVPGTWQIDRFVPATGVFLLPAFYGLDAPSSYSLRDGPPGRAINRAIETRLDVVVPGRWIDLGFANIYTTGTPVQGHADLRGLLIRIAGGEANAERLRALGITPLVVAWPDLPAALESGRLDGLMTTHETVASARLWERGVRHAFEDRQYFAQYVPLIAGRFWKRLPTDLRTAIAETWEAQVEAARAEAAAAQQAARAELVAHGVTIITPSEQSLRARRRAIAGNPVAAIEAMGLGTEVAMEVLRGLGAGLDAGAGGGGAAENGR